MRAGPLRKGRGEAHGVAVLAVTHDLAGERRLAVGLTAELADEPLPRAAAIAVYVHLLARQRRASTVGAALPSGLQLTDAAAQQKTLQLLDVADRERHGASDFAVAGQGPAAVDIPSANRFGWQIGVAGLSLMGGGGCPGLLPNIDIQNFGLRLTALL